MKLRSEKILDGNEWRNAETGAANVTSTDPLEVGEQTLIRPDRHHHDDPEGSGDDSERQRIKESHKTSERSETFTGEEMLLKETCARIPRAVVGERNNPL